MYLLSTVTVMSGKSRFRKTKWARNNWNTTKKTTMLTVGLLTKVRVVNLKIRNVSLMTAFTLEMDRLIVMTDYPSLG